MDSEYGLLVCISWSVGLLIETRQMICYGWLAMHSDVLKLNSETETGHSGLWLLHYKVTSLHAACYAVLPQCQHAMQLTYLSLHLSSVALHHLQCACQVLHAIICDITQQKSEDPAEPACWLLQHAREEEIAERKAMKRAERDIARKKEYVRRVRLQIEEKRAEVSAALMQWVSNNVASISYHSMLPTPGHF